MNFFFQIPIFVLSLLVFYYLPAEAVFTFGKVTLRGWRRLTIALVTGIALATVIGLFFAAIQARYLVFPTLLILSLLAIRKSEHWRPYVLSGWSAPHVLLIVLSILFSIPVITSGWFTPSGLQLRTVNDLDGIWNIALIRELVSTFPPQHPAIADIPLHGYHFFYNFWAAELARLLPLDVVHLHYHFLPLLMAFLFVYGVYEVSLRLSRNTAHAAWATFFAIAGGSFAFVLPVFFKVHLSIDDGFGINQPMSLLLSPSFVSSFILFLYASILLDEYLKKPSFPLAFGVVLLSGLTIGFKVYGGILVLVSLASVGIYRVWRERNWDVMMLALLSGLVSVVVFYPFNAAYGFLKLQIFWPPHRLMQGTLDFTQWELKRQTLTQQGSFWGLVKLELWAFGIFVLGNLGTRLVGLLGFLRHRQFSLTPLLTMLLIAIGVSFLLPMFFIQPIGPFNMIQFYWYFLVLVGIFAGWGISRWLSTLTVRWRYLVAACLILLTIPSAKEKLNQFVFDKPGEISRSELDLYEVLANQGKYQDVVLVIPALEGYALEHLEAWFEKSAPPRVTAFANKRTYLGNEVVQFPYEEWKSVRIELLFQFMSAQAPPNVDKTQRRMAELALRKLSNAYNIRYIVTKIARPWFESEPGVHLVFRNSYGSIYEVLPL